MPKRTINLPPAERERLLKLVSQGQHPISTIRRAYILLHSEGGRTDEAIAQFLFCSEDTVRRTRVRYLTEGLDAALEDKPRPGREPVLNVQQEAYLIALACSTPPAGQERWTLELLARQMISDEQVVDLSTETVRLTLKKQTQALARKELVYRPDYARVLGPDGGTARPVCATLR
jgi:transposase